MRAIDLEPIAARARGLARDVLAPRAEVVDAEARWPVESLRALQREGLAGLVVPQEFGGLGLGTQAIVRVCEELGFACASTGICFGMHLVASAVIAAKATPYQAETYLVPIAQGEHLSTLALSEPGTGSEFYLPQCPLHDEGEAFRVSGSKSFVTSGGHSDSYVVSTLGSQPETPHGQFSLVVIPGAEKGIQWGPPWEGFGLRGNQSRGMELRDVIVPRRDLLGEEGDQIWYVFHVVAPYFLAAMAGTYLGVARRAFEEARQHMGTRTYSHSGAKLSEATLPQHRLAQLWTGVERTRRYVYWATLEYDRGGPEALQAVLMTKAESASCAVSVVNEAMTLTGGIAYRESSVLSRLLRDARAAHVMAPTTDHLQIWAGRTLLGLPVLG